MAPNTWRDRRCVAPSHHRRRTADVDVGADPASDEILEQGGRHRRRSPRHRENVPSSSSAVDHCATAMNIVAPELPIQVAVDDQRFEALLESRSAKSWRTRIPASNVSREASATWRCRPARASPAGPSRSARVETTLAARFSTGGRVLRHLKAPRSLRTPGSRPRSAPTAAWSRRAASSRIAEGPNLLWVAGASMTIEELRRWPCSPRFKRTYKRQQEWTVLGEVRLPRAPGC